MPPKGIEVGANALLTTGALKTFSVAVAVKPVPPLAEVTAPVVLTNAPVVVPLTLTVKLQVVLAGMVAPLMEMLVAAATGAKVPVAQLFVAPGAAATSSPAGKVSVTPTPVSATVFAAGFVIAMVKVETPLFRTTAVGANDLAMVGAATTAKVAVLLGAPAVGVCAVVTPEVVFVLPPTELLVTLKITVQFPFAGIVIALKFKAVAPAAKLFGVVPTQVPVTAPPAALILVSVSVNEAFVNAGAAFGLVKVSVTVDVPPTGIEVGENALAMVGGDKTVNVNCLVVAAPQSSVKVTVTV